MGTPPTPTKGGPVALEVETDTIDVTKSAPVTIAEKMAVIVPDEIKAVTVPDEESTEPGDQDEEEEEEEESGPLTIEWPKAGDGVKAYVSFVVYLPILLALIITVPDPRREGWAKYYPISFTMSILWIAVFTYLMVWFVTAISSTLGVPVHILGLTVLAAGTSVPDLLTSSIV